MDMRIPPLIKIMLESNPPKSRILARRLAVVVLRCARFASASIYLIHELSVIHTYKTPITRSKTRLRDEKPFTLDIGGQFNSFVSALVVLPDARFGRQS